jgi:hypothetical protein
MAHPVTESSTVAANPPWTPPSGFERRSSARAVKRTEPRLTSTMRIGMVWAMVAIGSYPSAAAS